MTKRTIPQNRALHLYLEMIAEQLSDSGRDMKEIVKVPIKPTKENVKAELFRPVMQAMYPDVESTADLSTEQMQEVYKVFDYAVSTKLGVSAAWPSAESLSMEMQK